jgi:hypothetical protein
MPVPVEDTINQATYWLDERYPKSSDALAAFLFGSEGSRPFLDGDRLAASTEQVPQDEITEYQAMTVVSACAQDSLYPLLQQALGPSSAGGRDISAEVSAAIVQPILRPDAGAPATQAIDSLESSADREVLDHDVAEAIKDHVKLMIEQSCNDPALAKAYNMLLFGGGGLFFGVADGVTWTIAAAMGKPPTKDEIANDMAAGVVSSAATAGLALLIERAFQVTAEVAAGVAATIVAEVAAFLYPTALAPDSIDTPALPKPAQPTPAQKLAQPGTAQASTPNPGQTAPAQGRDPGSKGPVDRPGSSGASPGPPPAKTPSGTPAPAEDHPETSPAEEHPQEQQVSDRPIAEKDPGEEDHDTGDRDEGDRGGGDGKES